MIVGTKELARLLSLDISRIGQLVEKGLPKEGRGKFEDSVCIRWYVDFKSDSTPAASTDVNEARKKLYDAQVVKTELETSRIKRETIPADEHMIDMNQLGVMFSSGLDAIGGRLAAQLAGMDDPAVIAEHLTTETNAIRETVADAITTYSGTVSHR